MTVVSRWLVPSLPQLKHVGESLRLVCTSEMLMGSGFTQSKHGTLTVNHAMALCWFLKDSGVYGGTLSYSLSPCSRDFDRTPDGCWGSVWGNPFFSLSSFTEAESTARATEWCLWGPLESRSSSLRENYSTGIWPLGHSQVVALLSTKTAGFGDRSWV